MIEGRIREGGAGRPPTILVVWAITAALVLGGVGTAPATPDGQPSVLFRRLQTVPLRDPELPPHFRLPPRSSVPYPGRPTAWKPGHAIAWKASGAELAFAVEGPDRVDFLGFTVYQSLRQARAALAAGPKSHHFGFAPANSSLVGKVRGLSQSTLWRAHNAGMTIVEGEVLNGSTEVRSLTVVAGRHGHGDVPANIAMIRAGLRHLHRVEKTG